MPSPGVDNNLTKMFLKFTNLDDVAFGQFSDADPLKISDKAKMTF